MSKKVLSAGSVGSRIAWARVKGPTSTLFIITIYVPHKYRKSVPFAADTIEKLTELLRSVPKSDCMIIADDFNCQLRRNVSGCTGK